jgi:hypothetical protein
MSRGSRHMQDDVDIKDSRGLCESKSKNAREEKLEGCRDI